jgi:integrase
MARYKLSGTLVERTDGSYAARIPEIEDGVRVKKTHPLGTTSRVRAKHKMARLIAELEAKGQVTADAATRSDTFHEAAERWHAQRERDGVKSVKTERARVRDYARPALGTLDVTKIGTLEINDVLDECKAAGKSRQTVAHLKMDLVNVFGMLKREGAVLTNPAEDAELPKFPKTTRQERAVLTDDELARYLAWEHPQPRHRGAVLERQTMACVARMFGGLRTGDLHALKWEALDAEGGRFEFGWAPRQKTERPQLLEIPAMLRPILRDWWERSGRPQEGPIFATRRGKRVGKEKGKTSHAEAFRRDLERAFGLVTWKETGRDRKGGPLGTWEPAPGRQLTRRDRELFQATEFTLPVDFHSWRRAYAQALADADVSIQQSLGLTGHADVATHARYLRNAGKMRRLPEAALPALDVSSVQFSRPPVQNTPELASETGTYQGERASEKRQPVQRQLTAWAAKSWM